MGWRLPLSGARARRALFPAVNGELVGREAELRALMDRHRAGRLLTLCGPPGIGKTRLGIELGAKIAGDAERPAVAFADLERCSGADAVAIAVADAIDVVPAARRAARDTQIAHALRARGTFTLLLDGIDRSAAEVTTLVARWLAHAPELSVVLTARARTKAAGETTVEVGGLALPSLEVAAAASPAMALWRRAARRAGPAYAPSASDGTAITWMLKVLDGVPGAIELVAARAAATDAVTLMRQLSARFDQAPGQRGRADTADRMQRAAEWAVDTLESAEQSALLQCAVFRGGFTASDVADVVALPAGTSAKAMIERLRDRGLVQERPPASESAEPRFELGRVLAGVAEARLTEAAARGARARHAARFGTRGAGLAEKVETTGSSEALARLVADRDNLLVAATRFAPGGEGAGEPRALASAGAALLALEPLIASGTLPRDYRRLLDAVIGAPDADAAIDAELRASLLSTRGVARLVEGDDLPGAQRDLEAALLLARKGGQRALEGRALRNLGVCRGALGDLAGADSALGDALQLLRKVGDRRSEGRCLLNLGRIHRHRGQVDQARRDHEGALELMRGLGDAHFEAVALTAVAVLALERDELAIARARYEEALPVLERLGLGRDRGMAIGGLAGIAHLEGRLDEARELYERAMLLLRHSGDRTTDAAFLGYVGLVDFEQGDLQAAARRLGEARDAVDDKLYAPLFTGYLAGVHAALDRAQEAEKGFTRAETDLRQSSASLLLWAVQAQRGQLDLHAARRSTSAVDEAAHLAAARRRIDPPHEDDSGPSAVALQGSADARMSRRILERCLDRHRSRSRPPQPR